MATFESNSDNSENSGALSRNLPGTEDRPPYYITTAIAYTNGYPHIGHAYEFITADILARYHRVLGYRTFFLTGSDEHGQKVAASAEKCGRTPKDHCDHYVDAFKSLNNKLNVSYDRYIRTTDEDHMKSAQKLWSLCADAGDIYLDAYEGWYNEREELFVTETDAEAAGYKDPGSGVPLKRVKEESYFFRMSNYCDRLIAYIEENPEFIQPEQYRNNILARLTKEGLKDLSVSRTSFNWGIPVPEGFDQKHVMYVWFDALSNYISGVHGLESDHELSSYWPANHHIIGKDIIWFHCVIWPCILLSAKVPLPKCVYSHGFVNAADGRKMSKTYGNTIDPNDVLSKYGSDSVRYYSCASVTYGADLNFSEPGLTAMHNSELADILGNLVHRVMNLCVKYCGGVIPDVSHDTAFGFPFDIDTLRNEITNDLKQCSINLALFRAMEAARATNRFLTEAEPWKMKGSDESRRPSVVRTTMEAVYVFTHFLAPVIPVAADAVFKKLNTPPTIVSELKSDFYNLKPGTSIEVGSVLFQKIEQQEIVEKPAPVAKKAAPKAEPVVEDPNQSYFTKIDIRVGRIVRVWNHETAERLFCEEIEVGEDTPRTVASGLRQHYTLAEMENRLVLVVCNLKEAKMQGFLSTGMVLAAKSADGSKVELVSPPEGAKVGERVFIEGLTGEPLPAARVKKLKSWEAMVVDLKTNAQGEASWQGAVIQTSAGTCKVQTLTEAPIS